MDFIRVRADRPQQTIDQVIVDLDGVLIVPHIWLMEHQFVNLCPRCHVSQELVGWRQRQVPRVPCAARYPHIKSTMCAYVHERPVRHLQVVAPEWQVGIEGECSIEKRWLIIIMATRLKHDGNKASQHRQISKQPLECILNFVTLCHFPNEHNVGATAVQNGT